MAIGGSQRVLSGSLIIFHIMKLLKPAKNVLNTAIIPSKLMLRSLQIEDYHPASGRIPCQNVKQNAASCFIIDLKLGALNLKSLAPKSKHRP